MLPADFDFAIEITGEMGWGLGRSDFEFMMELEPKGCFVLLEDSRKIGMATVVTFGKVAWFGNLIVNKGKRGKGGGSLLVNHALEYLKNRKVTSVGLYAYMNKIPFYKRLGFQRDLDFLVLKGKAVISYDPSNVKKAEEEDISWIADFDKSCFGVSRERMLRPILSDHDNLGYICIKEGKTMGYAVAKIFGGFAELGPIVCRRGQVKTALNLIEAVLKDVKDIEVSLFVPENEPEVTSMLIEKGFRETFRVKRMFHGPAVANDCIYTAESLERG